MGWNTSDTSSGGGGGGGGGEVIVSVPPIIATLAGVSGDLVSITPPLGCKVKLLACLPENGFLDGISISFGGRLVFYGSLSDAPSQYYLTLSQAPLATVNEYLSAGSISGGLCGDTDEVLLISKAQALLIGMYTRYIIVR